MRTWPVVVGVSLGLLIVGMIGRACEVRTREHRRACYVEARMFHGGQGMWGPWWEYRTKPCGVLVYAQGAEPSALVGDSIVVTWREEESGGHRAR